MPVRNLEPLDDDRAGFTFELQDGDQSATGTLWQLTDAYGFDGEQIAEMKRLEVEGKPYQLQDGIYIKRVA